MSEIKKFPHTPGPWSVDRRASGRVVDNAGTAIASACIALRVLEEAQANALLIAAAPELLEALREMLSLYIWDSDSSDRAKAAIAKATGGAQ